MEYEIFKRTMWNMNLKNKSLEYETLKIILSMKH